MLDSGARNVAIPNVFLPLAYTYNGTGTVASVNGWSTSTGRSTISVGEQYEYDVLRRLTNATVTSGSSTTSVWYEYDSIGNRVRQSLNNTVTSYTYNPLNNELTRTSTPTTGATTFYSYDKNGQLLTKNVTIASTTFHWTYTWDVPGHLLKVMNETSAMGFYAYDALGRRLETKEGSSTVFTGYQGTETLADQCSQGNASNDYLYANGLLIANAGACNGLPNYYTTDALGSVRLRTDQNGNVVFSDNYQPFGQDNGKSTGPDTYRFTGKPYSIATGLYYY